MKQLIELTNGSSQTIQSVMTVLILVMLHACIRCIHITYNTPHVYLTARVLLVGVQDYVGITIVELSIVTFGPVGHLRTSALL